MCDWPLGCRHQRECAEFVIGDRNWLFQVVLYRVESSTLVFCSRACRIRPTLESESPRLTPAVQTLIAINFAMIVLQLAGVPYSDVATWFGFDSNALPGRWWTVGTYMFVHAGVLHLVAEHVRAVRVWSARRACVGDQEIRLVLSRLRAWAASRSRCCSFAAAALVGASAPVFGVLTAYAMQWPDDELYLMFIVPMRARTLAAGMFGFAAVRRRDGCRVR